MAATIKCDTLQNTSSATANVTLDGSGNATVGNNLTVTGQTIPSSSFKRNRLINGNMQVWQRATSYALTNSYVYGSADRWETDMGSTAAATASQSTSVPTTVGQLFQYSLKVQRTAASTSTGNIVVAQAIETVNSYDLAGSSATLSFYARCGTNYSPTSSALYALVFFGQGTDQSITNMRNNAWTGQTNAGGTATLTTSWQRFTFTVSVPAGTTQMGMQVYASPTGTAGADDSFFITGVQLEVGSAATPYERQIYSDQLAQCQRYYAQSNPLVAASALYLYASPFILAWNFSGTNGNSTGMPFPVSMRAAPTVTLYTGSSSTNATANFISYYQSSWTNVTASAANISSQMFYVSYTTGATGSAYVQLNYAASAEL